MEPRRRRISATHTILVQSIAPKEEFFAKTCNVGAKGCLFACEEGFGVGAALKILLAAQGHVIVTSARVRHETTRGTTVLVGVEFEPLTPEHRRQWELCLAFALARATADRPSQARPPAERPRRETIRDNSRELIAFLSLLGRELRPALKAISRNSSQILKSPLFPEEVERARQIHDVSRYLLGLAHQVRGMRLRERGELVWSAPTYDPGSALRSALTLVRAKARVRGIWFREAVDASVPARLKGNGLPLHEFLVELLSAAVRLSGGPRCTVSMAWSPAGLAVRVSEAAGNAPSRGDRPPKKTLLGSRLMALAEQLGAQLTLRQDTGSTELSAEVPALASVTEASPGNRPINPPVVVKPGRPLVVLPSHRSFEWSCELHDQVAAQRLRWMLRRQSRLRVPAP